MAREVRHDENGPAVFEESDLGDDGQLYVCRCGLSSEGALCDGSHNATADEAQGTVYKYEDDDPDGDRRPIDGVEFGDE
ncbi:CDGSH iron-sulfur domain-containing protein [Natronomonas sp. F2-12]|jgi:CDGSH-type Zn-finger protein|uniref:CDGSH iron-sulfur domain-containing protein n=1 Tax=Natronomonas aquatica TaxID=2841590 RepID=A0A9R1CV29_9EURY|nr:CDGSH iron-sulfur domain-containing protein [Natronomonas aquatica]MCQ4334323.1 CDGSH iron-sulfur domain-containing protein [Natronomonas aquatica]